MLFFVDLFKSSTSVLECVETVCTSQLLLATSSLITVNPYVIKSTHYVSTGLRSCDYALLLSGLHIGDFYISTFTVVYYLQYKQEEADALKRRFAGDTRSDHIALLRAFQVSVDVAKLEVEKKNTVMDHAHSMVILWCF